MRVALSAPQSVGASLGAQVVSGRPVPLSLDARTHVMMTNTLNAMSDVSGREGDREGAQARQSVAYGRIARGPWVWDRSGTQRHRAAAAACGETVSAQIMSEAGARARGDVEGPT